MNGQLKCPKCGGKVIIYRVKTNDYLCRRCGEIFKNEESIGIKK